jgi:hypothetical protein
MPLDPTVMLIPFEEISLLLAFLFLDGEGTCCKGDERGGRILSGLELDGEPITVLPKAGTEVITPLNPWPDFEVWGEC